MTTTILLNWLWQGAVVALAAACFLRVTPFLPAHLRYRALWTALVAVVALPGVAWLWTTAPARAVAGAIVVEVEPVIAPSWTAWVPVAIALLWGVWTAASGTRLVRALGRLRRARLAAEAFPAERESALTCWRAAAHAAGPGEGIGSHTGRRPGPVRRATLVVSPAVSAAAVLGGWRPFIAVAPAVLEALSDEELDRVVMHEYAHVQRRDDLAVIAQGVLHALAGWHPAVWWLGRALRLEREVACDELAIAVTGEARAYARCLTRLAALRAGGHQSLGLVAVGSTSALGRRVVRMLARPVTSSRHARACALAAVLASTVLALGVGRVSIVTIARTLTSPASAVPGAAAFIRQTADGSRDVPALRQDEAPAVQRRASGPSRAHHMPSVQGLAGRADVVDVVRPPDRPPVAQAAVAAGSTAPAEPRTATGADGTGTEAVQPQNSPVPDAPAPDASIPDAVAAVPVLPSAPVAPVTPWRVAADSGVAIGRTSQKAAVATAGFFNRFGKRLAGAF